MIYLDQWLKRLGLLALVVVACVLAALVIARHGDNGGPIPTPEQVREAGAVPVEDASAGKIERLTKENASLRDQLARVRKTYPNARSVAYAEVETKVARAEGEARPGEPTPAGGAATALPPCLLRFGDEARVKARGSLVDIDGRKGLIGTAELWRWTPGPPAAIWSGELAVLPDEDSEGSGNKGAGPGKILAVPPPGIPRWMAGPIAGVSGQGMMLGGVLLTPEKRVWRVTGRGVAGLMAGQGDAAVWGGVVFGW